MYVTLQQIHQAKANLAGVIVPTPLQESRTFSELTGNGVYLKTENLQKTGSFKIRGAYNKIVNLTEQEKENGIVAFSAGNHGAGTAYAAQRLGISATVVMPTNPVASKKNAIMQYGAKAIEYGTTSIDMYEKALELHRAEGRTMIHPFEDPYVIAGQGTIGLEILQDLPETEAVIVPVSGGGLISGVAAALKEIKPTLKVIGVNTEGAMAMYMSLQHGKPMEVEKVETIADGLMAKKPGDLTFAHTQRYVDDLVLVSEEAIANCVAFMAERTKLVVEPSGAAAMAAMLSGNIKLKGKKTVVMVSGGNISFELYQSLIQQYNEKNY
ncbi:threonine ammonia-lyase [Planococcus shenhongbingii]|uniref:L-threonine dehydratase catabolic TdcB n=1 Tax=Planococcus shenhongbingii TaxID=3058398 RepID=A0ABT8NB32_9BACL|nr:MULTISPECIES: threonine ammonia-lyase [unclassified Planococcus (in: firmicutes)]MDN7245100.1 threonine ammonia-lyase [Planococcus sp. N017]WKA58195.1 threonine ammonia-lyase [Planococcus sp. N016]